MDLNKIDLDKRAEELASFYGIEKSDKPYHTMKYSDGREEKLTPKNLHKILPL